jgi:DNA-binding NarL/FixJ family response regulator
LLTEREREVLGYVAMGLPQKQIARLAGISVKTVQHHITHLMDKLEIHDRVELARFAIREGLVEA